MSRTVAVRRLIPLLAGILALGAPSGLTQAPAPPRGGPPGLRLIDLDGRPVDPMEEIPTRKATVFLFTTTECPISQRYSPVVRRLHQEFDAAGARFVLVFADPADTAAEIRAHLQRFDLAMNAVRDPRHDLVRLTRVTVTPEAAVFDAAGRMVYRGRIDDRYVDFGVDRPQAHRHDLREALVSTLAGRPVAHPETKAVGCFLTDLVR
jgi:hypothetical protein